MTLDDDQPAPSATCPRLEAHAAAVGGRILATATANTGTLG